MDVPSRSVIQIEFAITAIDNPRQQPFTLSLSAVTSSAGERVEVGQVSPFPNDTPARYVLPLPPAAAALVAGNRGRSLTFAFAIAAIDNGPLDGALRVTLSPPTLS